MLFFNGQPLTDDRKSLTDYGVKVHDILLVRRKPTNTANTSRSAAGSLSSGAASASAAAGGM